MNDNFLQKITIDWDKIINTDYVRSIPAIKNISTLDFTVPVTFFAGENGTGKSTLLEAIAILYGFNPEGGSRNYNFSTYDSYSSLHSAMKLTKGYRKARWGYFYRAESYYNVSTKEIDYSDDMHPSRQLHNRSHGESFLELMDTQFAENSIYFMDEPESALSPQRQLSLLSKIYEYSCKGSQFIIATHSPILLSVPGADILSFDNGKISKCSYEDTGCYQIMELFINHRNQLLPELLKRKGE